MAYEFSKATKLYLECQDILLAAEDRFKRELGNMLREVQRRFSRKGWASRFACDPPAQIQIFRQHWPAIESGIHYEARAFENFRRQGIVDLSLHIEHDVPNQEAICYRIRQMLRRYGAKVLQYCATAMPDQPKEDILKGSIRLVDLTVDSLCDTLERMTETESFLDEALFLTDKRTIWRTDFSPTCPEINSNWFGNIGSQEIAYSKGRIGSSALRIDGTQPNARRGIDYESGCYSVLLHSAYSLTNGNGLNVTVVVKTHKGGIFRLYGEGHKGRTAEGHPLEFPQAFSLKRIVEPSETWQCLTWHEIVPSVEQINYDFAKEGLWCVMIVKTNDTEFLVDSIELAQNSP